MARYLFRSFEVEAELYRLGLEDEFSTRAVPVLVTSVGRLELAIGDWIVTRDSGEREVVKPLAFEKLYEPCSTNAGFRTLERPRRGIPLRSG